MSAVTRASEVEDTTGVAETLRRVSANGSLRVALVTYLVAVAVPIVARLAGAQTFGSVTSVTAMLVTASFVCVVGFGQTAVILTGGIDLSIPSVISFAATLLTGFGQGSDLRALWVIPMVVLVGAAIGAANGLLVTLLAASPVVITLATNVIFSGVTLGWTNGSPTGTAPPVVVNIMQGAIWRGFPTVLIYLLGFIIVGVLVLHRTVFGQRVYGVGDSAHVAYLSGVPVARVLTLVYALSGACAALVGMMLAGFAGTSVLDMGDPYLLLSIAAVAVGGTMISGGQGYVLGTVGAAILLTTIATVLAGTTLPDAVRSIVFAIAILVAVLVGGQRAQRT